MPARGQPEAQPGKDARCLVHAVAHVYHDMIEDRGGVRHASFRLLLWARDSKRRRTGSQQRPAKPAPR
jgi:hypothetical protein